MKAFGEVKEGNVVTLDFVDGATQRRPQRRGEGHDSRRGVQPRADARSGSATSRCRPTSRRRCSAADRPLRRMPDFWPSCGYRLLTVGARRPADRHRRFPAQLPAAARARADRRNPAPRSSRCTTRCSRRRARAVAPRELAAIADADARENYGIWLRFRDAARRGAVARGRVRRAVPGRRRRRAAALRPPADADPAAAHPRRRRRRRSRRAPPKCCSGRRRSP